MFDHVNDKTIPYLIFFCIGRQRTFTSPDTRNNAFTRTETLAFMSSISLVSTEPHNHLCTHTLPTCPPACLSPLACPTIAVHICSRKDEAGDSDLLLLCPADLTPAPPASRPPGVRHLSEKIYMYFLLGEAFSQV